MVNTLPETNIAMENPPFGWYLPGKMGIFMGYVSTLAVVLAYFPIICTLVHIGRYTCIYIYFFFFHQQTRIYLYNKLCAYLNRSLYIYCVYIYIYLYPHLIRIYIHILSILPDIYIFSGTYSAFSRGVFLNLFPGQSSVGYRA